MSRRHNPSRLVLAVTSALLAGFVPWFGTDVAGVSAAQNAPQSKLRVTKDGIFVPAATFVRPESPSPVDAAPDPSGNFQDHAFILSAALWNSSTIPVCWERLDDSAIADRELVRNAINGSWSAHSKLVFLGWQQCPSKFNGIRIGVSDSGPHTKGLGKTLSGVSDGMILNFAFSAWGPECLKTRAACIKSIAVHEFGHAIGFAHEHMRPDTPGECKKPKAGSVGDRQLTSWDPHSVMNYCNSKYINDGILSELDRYAVALVYGAPI